MYILKCYNVHFKSKISFAHFALCAKNMNGSKLPKRSNKIRRQQLFFALIVMAHQTYDFVNPFLRQTIHSLIKVLSSFFPREKNSIFFRDGCLLQWLPV
jgi:hypothetical protein